MKIELKNTPEQQALFRDMASKDKSKAGQAREIFAALMGPLIGQVLDQADTTNSIYKTFTYNDEDDPSLPVQPLLNVNQNWLSVWSNSVAGGLSSNRVYQPIDEIKFTSYRLDSAISWNERYARKARLDVISLYLTRMAQEILLKRNRNAWSVVLTALANGQNQGVNNVSLVGTAGLFTLQDLNNLFTRVLRQNESWAFGTPVGGSPTALTDLYMSPEVFEQIRAFAYQPINTLGADGNAAGAGDVIRLPDNMREEIFNNGGNVQSLFGLKLNTMIELGVGQKYTVLFDQVAGTNSYTKNDGSGGTTFQTTNDLVIAVDSSRDFAWRAMEVNEGQENLTMVVDDQFSRRSEVLGFYSYQSLAHIVTDTHAISALII